MVTVRLLLLLIISFPTIGQEEIDYSEERPKNNLSLNLFGDGLAGINYERMFFVHPSLLIVTKVGLAYSESLNIFGGSKEYFILYPHHITVNFGRKYVFGEIGLGGSIVRGDGSKNYYIYPMAGMKFLPLRSKRICFKIYLQVPYSTRGVFNAFITPVGMNFGFSF